jgi:topoisomerase IV subunit A
MSNEKNTPNDNEPTASNTAHPDEMYKVTHLDGMYQNWFLDYASYVILERAVPDLQDGLKPVQRRILHSMKRLDDGRYNKVANIIGHTMQFHPHGDASIGDALVQLGQKDLLIDCQGNWGNLLTGDSAAAPRYIEARLSKFALDVVFNPKTTEWKLSYDGRNREPVALPIKFPLLLSQGVEGIAVGLASKILPHNFNELVDASIAQLEGKEFQLFPDFPTGGFIDIAGYNDGLRGGSVKVRARINKLDKKTLVITEIPFSETTSSLIESILKANEKGKIKIRKVDDNTAENVEILVHLAPGISPDITIDALYAFTNCQISISPNACVVSENRPLFMGVSEILRTSTNNTLSLLRQELEIRQEELGLDWHLSSLEKIFFEEKIYRELERDVKDWDAMLKAIEKGFIPFRSRLKRDISHEDIEKLTDKPVRKISKFDIKKADEHITNIEKELKEIQHNLKNLVAYAIKYFREIQKKYGTGRERRTEIRNFDTIKAVEVAVANAKLYVNYEEGFAGTGLKKDTYVCDCSDMDDVIVFRNDGKYFISKVQEKAFIGKGILHVNIYNRNSERTVYNVIYRDGRNGLIMVKRCMTKGLMRDKEYDITKGTEGSSILFFSANPNGETETLKVKLKPRPRLRNLVFDFDFNELAVKGRDAQGNILTRYAIHKIELISKTEATVAGQNIWYDETVNRINSDGKGLFLGEFNGNDRIIAFNRSGSYSLYSYDLQNHFEEDLLLIEKFNPKKIYSAVYIDGEQHNCYLKRFRAEPTEKLSSFTDDNEATRLMVLLTEKHPQIKLVFGGKNRKAKPEIVDVSGFITVKGLKAKGRKLSTYEVAEIEELEPLEKEDIPEADADGSLFDLSGGDETSFEVEDRSEIMEHDDEDLTLEL